MILVQNLRLRLSGSKIAILLFVLVASSCSIFKSAEDGSEKKEDKPVTEKPTRKTDSVVVEKEKPLKEPDSLEKVYPIKFKETYNLGFFLPLYLNPEDQETKSQKAISTVAQDFLLGAKLALDTLKYCGSNFRVFIHDTRNDSNTMKKVLYTIEYKDLDLIIGPLFKKSLTSVSEYSARKKINLIPPFAQIDSCMDKNPYYLSPKPSSESIGKRAAEFTTRKFQNYHIYLIRSYDPEEGRIINTFKANIDTGRFASVREAIIPNHKWNLAHQYIDSLTDDSTLIFFPTENEVFASSILSYLRKKEIDLTILARSKWLNFKSFEGPLMEKFNLHTLTSYYVNYQDEKVKAFVKKYRKAYHTEPNEYAIIGYDVTLYSGRMLNNYGVYFQRNFPIKPIQCIHTNYSFIQKEGSSGWLNENIQIINFKDFELRRVNSPADNSWHPSREGRKPDRRR